MTVYVNRPWTSSFNFESCKYSIKNHDQLRKLVRNFIASLDLGGPMNLVGAVDSNVSTRDMDEKQKYLQWVRQWKAIYKGLSETIRAFKRYRKDLKHLSSGDLSKIVEYNVPYSERGKTLSEALVNPEILKKYVRVYSDFDALKETAQVMLNARYNAKLASWARVNKRLSNSK